MIYLTCYILLYRINQTFYIPTNKGIKVLAIEVGINILTFSIGRTFVSFLLEYAKRKGIKVLAIEKGKTFDFLY